MLQRVFQRLRRLLHPGGETQGLSADPAVELAPLTAAELSYIQARFTRRKYFIFGHARSGTTLLARLVRVHPEVHCNWQAQFFSDRGPIPVFSSASFQRWLNHPSNRWVSEADPTTVLLRLASDYLLEQQAEQVGKPIVGDKSPNGNGVRAIQWLASIYPDGKLLYIVRDGRDTILSKRVQAFVDQPEGLSREDRQIREHIVRAPDAFFDGSRSIFSQEWLRSATLQWAADVQDCLARGERLFGGRFFWLRFEDLIDSPYEKMLEVWRFLQASPQDENLERNVIEEIGENPAAEWHASRGFEFVERIPRGVQGAWKSIFTAEDTRLFEALAGPTLKALGYR